MIDKNSWFLNSSSPAFHGMNDIFTFAGALLSWDLGSFRKRVRGVHDRLVGQVCRTLSLRAKVHVISRHKRTCVLTSGQRAQWHILSSHTQTSPKAHGGREDGDGRSWGVSCVFWGQETSSQTSQQIREVVSAMLGRAAGDHVLCVHWLRVSHRERGGDREASASAGARSGCGCLGGLHGWNQVRLIYRTLWGERSVLHGQLQDLQACCCFFLFFMFKMFHSHLYNKVLIILSHLDESVKSC